jgi:hypothetical protein
MSSGACNLASCSSAALLDTRHALVADPEPFTRLVVSNSPQRARWRRLCSAGQGGPEDLIHDPDRQGQVRARGISHVRLDLPQKTPSSQLIQPGRSNIRHQNSLTQMCGVACKAKTTHPMHPSSCASDAQLSADDRPMNALIQPGLRVSPTQLLRRREERP